MIVARELFADGLLAIDFRRKIASFTRALSLTSAQSGVLVYEKVFGVQMTIGTVHARGNLDTGATVAFISPGYQATTRCSLA